MLTTPLGRVAIVAVMAVVVACERSTEGGPLGVSTDAVDRGDLETTSMMVTKTFKGSWDNTELPPESVTPPGCLVYFRTTQAGHSTQLGRFTGNGATCPTSQAFTDSPPFWDHDPAPPYAVIEFTNEMVWTAANGDELWLRPNSGVFVQSGATGAATVRGELTVAGGTGRFAGATGSLTVRGGRGPGETGDHIEFQGEITVHPGARGGGASP